MGTSPRSDAYWSTAVPMYEQRSAKRTLNCVRHFKIDIPFHCVQSKSYPFQSRELKHIISFFCNRLKICTKHTLFLQKKAFSYRKWWQRCALPSSKRRTLSQFFFVRASVQNWPASAPPPPSTGEKSDSKQPSFLSPHPTQQKISLG